MRGLRFSDHNTGTANANSRSEYLVPGSPADSHSFEVGAYQTYDRMCVRSSSLI